MESAPEFFQTDHSFAKNGDDFIIDDLLDFPSDDTLVAVDGGLETANTGTSTGPSTVTAVDTSCNCSFSAAEPYLHPADVSGPRSSVGGHFSGELCVSYDDLAELEWLSNFGEESFSSEDLQKLQLIQGMKARTCEASETHQCQFQPETTPTGPMLIPEMLVPAKARSKRSRAAPGNWTSRLHVVSPTPPTDVLVAVGTMSSSSESDICTKKKTAKPVAQKIKERHEGSPTGGEGRKCLHCATDKTPQWRTGPMGPKTLCNACGVRYKSGRLVPEYRPAASPTFVLTKHSNSHRKVLELRRQKELLRTQQHQTFLHHHHHQNMMFDVSNGDDYLIQQNIGPDFGQLIQRYPQ